MSNGDSARLESADPGSSGDPVNRISTDDGLVALAKAKEFLLQWAEQAAAQEIDDAVCRIVAEARAARERQRSGEALHGGPA